ncbi:MAG: hypothetical protein JJU32_13535 [Phormidium sp. BM_Day4_Bin.17]|nr:hypothetical protein [Phormidium sp. BM_Day4_Bin.17]UCJ13949.1 MAG: hypothetical protein JWS08_09605 [Phormidium sp. PBR-2020]
MFDLNPDFQERLHEIKIYLDFLDSINSHIQSGLVGQDESHLRVDPNHQKILHSSVYLQLYSLVESTVVQCLGALSRAIENQSIEPNQLSEALRKEWIRIIAQTDKDLTYTKRLKQATELYDLTSSSTPISASKFDLIKNKAGGNWDDKQIHKLSQRLGIILNIDEETKKAIKIPIRDDMGALVLIKHLRNNLAHGKISFIECSEGTSVGDLRDLTNKIASYLLQVVISFEDFINNNNFLV